MRTATQLLLISLRDSITFKVPELSFNYKKINYESEFGRRSVIRFFICVIVKDGKINIYKINSLLIYLEVLPSYGSVIKDINNFGTYITNFYLGKTNNFVDKLTKEQTINVNLFKKIISSDDCNKYEQELYNKLFALSDKEFKKQHSSKYKIFNESVDLFIKEFGKKYNDELICKNYKCFNKHFDSCFNIYGIDSIITKSNEFKVLEINSNPSTIVLKYFKRFQKIYNTKDNYVFFLLFFIILANDSL